MFKNLEKQQALKLRRREFSSNEILQKVPIAKSTLSLWLRSVDLVKPQNKRLTEKPLSALPEEAQTKCQMRVALEKKLRNQPSKISKI